jgi:hypothetical protein
LDLNQNEHLQNQTINARIKKVNNFIKYIESKFQKYYIPSKFISIDESVIKFSEKISFITYNKLKSTKWGIRIYVLADSTNGYIYSILPYYGSITRESLIRPELPITSKIVLALYSKLLTNIPNAKGYHIFCDSNYSSLPLAKELYQLKSHFTERSIETGNLYLQLQKKPEFTKSVKRIACQVNIFLLLLWKDKNIVTMISIISTSKMTKNYYDGSTKTLQKLEVIATYNKYMDGVEKADQLASSYCFLRKLVKWWRKILFWGLEVCSVNSYILLYINRRRGRKMKSQCRI